MNLCEYISLLSGLGDDGVDVLLEFARQCGTFAVNLVELSGDRLRVGVQCESLDLQSGLYISYQLRQVFD